jgi:DNA-binding transcriptional regulator GbsR (MarR family)
MADLEQAVERLGQVLEDSGVPRMPARVFAYILAEDRDRYTAAELADGLRVSPAAISGAVRYLTQTGLVVKERRPSGRGDLYRIVDGDVWGTIMRARLAQMDHYVASLQQAALLLAPGSPGRMRVEETGDYFAFAREGIADLGERWQEYRAERLSRPSRSGQPAPP